LLVSLTSSDGTKGFVAAPLLHITRFSADGQEGRGCCG
jgi:hypothetical protein